MKDTLPKPHAPKAREPGFWEGELGYPQAILVFCTAILLGLFYQWRMPQGVWIPPRVAWIAGFAGAAALAFVSIRYREARFIQWLTGVPYAIVATVTVGLVAAVGAIWPDEVLSARFGMASVYSSWPFAMVMLAMMANLIGVSARRLYPFSYRNFCFSLNHLGLAVAVLGGAMSAASLERGRLVLHEGAPVSEAIPSRGAAIPLPFTVTLKEFTLETFPPVLMVLRLDADHAGEDLTRGETLVKAGATETLDGFRVKVEEYLPRAANLGEGWVPVPRLKGAPPAARVSVTGPTGESVSGWLSSGGVVAMSGHAVPIDPAGLTLPDGRVLALMPPSPRDFRSEVTIREGASETERTVQVNKPLRVGAYKLYQVSYDDSMGAASTVSVLEAIRDPGLPVVYLGLYLLLAGAAFMLWNGVGTGATLSGPPVPGAPAPRKDAR